MDALSLALRSISLTSPLLARVGLAEHAAVTIANPGATPPRSFPFHYIVDGSCTLRIDDRLLELCTGDIVLLPGWPEHTLACGEIRESFEMRDLMESRTFPSWTEEHGVDSPIVMNIGHSSPFVTFLGGIFTLQGSQGVWLQRELPSLLYIRSGRHILDTLLKAALELMADDQAVRPGYAATASRLLEAVLVEALRIWVMEAKHRPGRLQGITDPTIARSVHAIHVHPENSWTVNSLASIAGRSRSTFADHFRRAVGTSPLTYVRVVRGEMAERLLVTTDDSVAKIAARLGYGSTFAFSRAFLATQGSSPSAYRRANRSAGLTAEK